MSGGMGTLGKQACRSEGVTSTGLWVDRLPCKPWCIAGFFKLGSGLWACNFPIHDLSVAWGLVRHPPLLCCQLGQG